MITTRKVTILLTKLQIKILESCRTSFIPCEQLRKEHNLTKRQLDDALDLEFRDYLVINTLTVDGVKNHSVKANNKGITALEASESSSKHRRADGRRAWAVTIITILASIALYIASYIDKHQPSDLPQPKALPSTESLLTLPSSHSASPTSPHILQEMGLPQDINK